VRPRRFTPYFKAICPIGVPVRPSRVRQRELSCLARESATRYDAEITVTVAAVKTIGRGASGAPIQAVSASARVQYNPIMLMTNFAHSRKRRMERVRNGH
jgi:hypothetical protein